MTADLPTRIRAAIAAHEDPDAQAAAVLGAVAGAFVDGFIAGHVLAVGRDYEPFDVRWAEYASLRAAARTASDREGSGG